MADRVVASSLVAVLNYTYAGVGFELELELELTGPAPVLHCRTPAAA